MQNEAAKSQHIKEHFLPMWLFLIFYHSNRHQTRREIGPRNRVVVVMNLINSVLRERTLKILQLWARKAIECCGHSLKRHSCVIVEANNAERKVDYSCPSQDVSYGSKDSIRNYTRGHTHDILS